jgi:flagella basal body P-ring formation protein FlgA
VFLPVTVKAWGPAWVIKRPVSAGEVLTQEDAEMAEVDWAEQRASVLATPALWVGQQAAHTLLPGQALRQHMVRATEAFSAGSQVRVTQTGAGFEVMVTGQALSRGLVGQSTRVRLPSGKIVTGLVRDGQTVELAL